jgi:hypothetical protein
MDGSGVRTVLMLNNSNIVNIFVFTLDYSRQMLYWMNGSDNCNYTNYIESSRVDGSERIITYDPSNSRYSSNGCYYGFFYRTQAIDFFGGAIYSYSGYYHDIIKTEVGNVLNITNFPYIDYYMCQSSYYNMHSGMKIISPERQPQGNLHHNNIVDMAECTIPR